MDNLELNFQQSSTQGSPHDSHSLFNSQLYDLSQNIPPEFSQYIPEKDVFQIQLSQQVQDIQPILPKERQEPLSSQEDSAELIQINPQDILSCSSQMPKSKQISESSSSSDQSYESGFTLFNKGKTKRVRKLDRKTHDLKRKDQREKSRRKQNHKEESSRKRLGRNPYPTKNFLVHFKKPHMLTLQRAIGPGVYEHPIVGGIKAKNGVSMKDYEALYNQPEFRQIFRNYFQNQEGQRYLMLSRTEAKTKIKYLRRIHVFSEAFKTRRFDHIN